MTVMKPVSLSAAWEETLAFMKREGALVFPVALLFIAIPLALILQVLPDQMRNMTPGTPPPAAAVLPNGVKMTIAAAALVILGGALSCYALAAKPGISLREALALGFRRVPHAFAAAFLVGLGLAIPLVALSAVSPAVGQLYMLAASLFFSVRFLFLNVAIVDQLDGPIAAVRRSWAMTRGNFWRLLLLIVAVAVPIMLVQVVAGMLLGLIGFALGGPELGKQLGDLATAVVLALGQLFMIVLTVRLYRQLSAS
ncbi:hypothetical protein OOT33_03990 [Sphingobium sp. DEHP117]|uniref:hypothetical protein n=1 Tax=Sphingobium sp. DEHP117 TaxID=2993436 RepID=UPI0027D54191|nr:hypothetical protein [Sphingobium sp. DEHP117]MDQ4419601.1 hypothetical protein [Sphingobium sp. DEHP117]